MADTAKKKARWSCALEESGRRTAFAQPRPCNVFCEAVGCYAARLGDEVELPAGVAGRRLIERMPLHHVGICKPVTPDARMQAKAGKFVEANRQRIVALARELFAGGIRE